MTAAGLAARVLGTTTYAPNPYSATAVPTPIERHLMNRLGCGYSRETWQQMRSAGGPSAWLQQQLTPASIAESPKIAEVDSWFPDLWESPERKHQRQQAGSKLGWEYQRDLGNWTMLRRIYSRRQVLETMVDFWSNHLHIPGDGGTWSIFRFHYDALIRRHALGRYEDLLIAATLDPAMLVYLDNYRSVRNAPNENHGRELLELHTVGRASGYTEEMVKDSAVILSGWTVGVKTSYRAYYDTGAHTTGGVSVLGFGEANTSSDGREMVLRYLRYLARHPATARTIATKLAIRFVSDTPPADLIDQLARVYLSSGTDIKAVLRALVASAAFQASANGKVRTPVDDLVATCRVLGVQAQKPTRNESFAVQIAYAHQGLRLFSWPRPDGAPERNGDWVSASRMLSSFRMHWLMAGGYYPKVDVTYRPRRSWLPVKRLRLDKYVDHLCRLVLGRPSTATDLKAVCQATGLTPGEVVHREHKVVDWMFPRVLVCLLDSPDHMTR